MTHSLLLPQSEDSWAGWQRTIPALGLIGVCAAASLSEVSAEEGQIFCPFRLSTGGWCPGCGGTRALKHLVHGDVSMSLSLNPFLLVLMTQLVAISVAFLAVPDKARTWFRENRLTFMKANIVMAIAIWIVRLWTDTIPTPFEVTAPLLELIRQTF